MISIENVYEFRKNIKEILRQNNNLDLVDDINDAISTIDSSNTSTKYDTNTDGSIKVIININTDDCDCKSKIIDLVIDKIRQAVINSIEHVHINNKDAIIDFVLNYDFCDKWIVGNEIVFIV